MKHDRARTRQPPPGERIVAHRKREPVPHAFVLDALASRSPYTRPMFGCTAVYLDDKLTLILRDNRDPPADNGVWLATLPEDHASLKREFPSMRSIEVFGSPVSSWQVLPSDAADFEEAAMHAVELILARDPRIGKHKDDRRGGSGTGTGTGSGTAKKGVGKRPGPA